MVFPLVLSSVDFFFISIAYHQELFKSLSSSSTCGRIIIPYRNPVCISNDTLDFSMELRNGVSLGWEYIEYLVCRSINAVCPSKKLMLPSAQRELVKILLQIILRNGCAF